MPTTRTLHRPLLPSAPRSHREAPRPSLVTAAGGFDLEAIMRLAHQLARENVARAAARGVVRRYASALKIALTDAWDTARTHRFCHQRDGRLAALPADHAAILVERTAALMIDSTPRMLAEVAMIDVRAAAIGIRL